MAKCEHENFEITARVDRLSATEGGPITSFAGNFTISCAECKMKFRFLGLPIGHQTDKPTICLDGTELHAPCKPAYVTEISTDGQSGTA